MSKLSLDDRALPKLTEVFPTRGDGGLRKMESLASQLTEEIAWRDQEAMRAKYGSVDTYMHQKHSRKKDIKFCNIKKV